MALATVATWVACQFLLATDPNILAYNDSLAQLKTGSTLGGVSRMVCRVDLHGGTDLRTSANRHWHHVQDYAVEIQEHVFAEMDVKAIVAMERRAD